MMKFKDTLKLIVTLSVIIVLIAGFYFYRESQEINGPGEIELVIAVKTKKFYMKMYLHLMLAIPYMMF